MRREERRRWWIVLYGLVGAASLFCYFIVKDSLAFMYIQNIKVSNFTLNYLLLMLTWGAYSPYLFRKRPFLLRWTLVLVGFFIILSILTIGGLHTQLTDLFKSLK